MREHSPCALVLCRNTGRLIHGLAPAAQATALLPMTRYTPMRVPRHQELSVRGLKHRLTWWGEPTGTPIVLLHGFQDCGDTWQFLVDCLPDTWSLVAPDWRGFGGSEWAPDGYWFPDYLADLEALLDALAPSTPAPVIAHSMGANIALLYGGIRPQRLK